jgi:hypothetical protein
MLRIIHFLNQEKKQRKTTTKNSFQPAETPVGKWMIKKRGKEGETPTGKAFEGKKVYLNSFFSGFAAQKPPLLSQSDCIKKRTRFLRVLSNYLSQCVLFLLLVH